MVSAMQAGTPKPLVAPELPHATTVATPTDFNRVTAAASTEVLQLGAAASLERLMLTATSWGNWARTSTRWFRAASTSDVLARGQGAPPAPQSAGLDEREKT